MQTCLRFVNQNVRQFNRPADADFVSFDVRQFVREASED
jgi:hypothetical protein